ncbi:Serine/threonine-protein kinase smg1 [Ancistrocladus abbreviatus]
MMCALTKGKRLEVPEIVPFCLIQILEAALGMTGVEVFRADCETVIDVLRKEKRHTAHAVGALYFRSICRVNTPWLGGKKGHGIGRQLKYELVSAILYCADQERSTFLLLNEILAKSMVAEATSNCEKTRVSYEIQASKFAQAKAMVTETAQEAATWIVRRGRILDAL